MMTDQLRHYRLFVDGEWCDAVDGGVFESLDPSTGEPWALVQDGTARDIDRAVAAAKRAFDGEWRDLGGFGRARLMHRLADLIEGEALRLAAMESRDNGKLIRETRGQVEVLPGWLRYFAGLADKIHGETIPAERSNWFVYTQEVPVGVVGAIVPWNSPLLLLMWKLAPVLAAGCTIVVKPSEHTPATALELADLAGRAGFPQGVFSVVPGGTPEPGEALVSHPDVAKIAFTGSTATGAAVASSAATQLTPAVLELGGKSAQIVFDDADVDAAVNGIVAGIFAAVGQTCIAGSRLLVADSLHDTVVEKLKERAASIVLGDPSSDATEMGPLATARQREVVLDFVDGAVAEGALVVAGGQTVERPGYFVEPTVLADVRPDMRVAREEVFGPVLAVMRFSAEEEAVRMANESPFGLAAGVWTENVQRAHRVADALRVGTVWVNGYRAVAPNVPFGGFGASGWGRENGVGAVHEYTATKSVWIEVAGAPRDPFRLG
jgi:acyl-CoA reductase-like NAD-dependent aldehyde dehydrogenase